jgi:DHA1 family multidrug resistance protein-like MFS transporter
MEGSARNLRVLSATVFVVYTGFAFVLPFLPLYLLELGVADKVAAARWAGLLIGIAPLLAGLLGPFWGHLGDRYGAKPVILVALGTSAVFLALSAGVRNPWELLGLRVATGLVGGVGPLSLALATALAPSSDAGSALGLVQGAQILAAAAGPLGGGLLADRMGIRPTFLLTAGLLVFAAVLVGTALEAPRAQGHSRPRNPAPILGKATLVVVAILFLVNFVGRSLTPILPLQLEGIGVPKDRLSSSTGALISTYAVAAAFSAVLLGRAARLRSPAVLLAASLLLGGLFVYPMAGVPSLPPFLALAAGLGLTSGGSLTLCYTLGGLQAPEHARGAAYGVFSGAALFGGAVSPSVAGYLARFDLRGIYYLDTAVFAGVGVFLLLLHHRDPGFWYGGASRAPEEGVAP